MNKKQKSALAFLMRVVQIIEKARISAQVRLSHLKKENKEDELTEQVFKELAEIEKKIDIQFFKFVADHPAFAWFSRIKGVGYENIAKILAFIDIEKTKTISSLWHYAGFHVVDGKAPKHIRGKRSDFNGILRTMCFRLGMCLLKANGKFKKIYDDFKAEEEKKFREKGYEITKKDRKFQSNKNFVSAQYLHQRALRKMIKRFLACLWLVWKEKIGEKPTKPYAFDILDHDYSHFIDPWDHLDLSEKQAQKKWEKIAATANERV